MTIYKATPHCFEPERSSNEAASREAWVRMALQFMRDRRAHRMGNEVFTAEDIAIKMKVLKFPDPPDARAWGTVMQRAKRDGFIVDTKMTRGTKSGHRTPVWTWA